MNNKYKIGDKIKIKGIDSSDSKFFNGLIGIIFEIRSLKNGRENYYMIKLSNERDQAVYASVWGYELESVSTKKPITGFTAFIESLA